MIFASSRLTVRLLLPVLKVTVSLGLISSVPVVPSAASFQPELLIASATVFAVTSESPLPTGAPTLPSVDGVKVVVTAAMLPLPSIFVVVPSVLADTV